MDLRLLIFLTEIFLFLGLPVARVGSLKLVRLLLKVVWTSRHPNHLGEGLCRNPWLDRFISNIPLRGWGLGIALLVAFFLIFDRIFLINIISIILFLQFFFVILELRDKNYFILSNLRRVREAWGDCLDLPLQNYYLLCHRLREVDYNDNSLALYCLEYCFNRKLNIDLL